MNNICCLYFARYNNREQHRICDTVTYGSHLIHQTNSSTYKRKTAHLNSLTFCAVGKLYAGFSTVAGFHTLHFIREYPPVCAVVIAVVFHML